MTIKVANAPVSYGVFEMTVGRRPNLPDAGEVLTAVAEAGYEGIDLGPLGFLGRGQELRDRLAHFGLALAGGYVAMRFTDPEGFRDDLGPLEETLDVFEAVGSAQEGWLPRPTLADAGSPERAANPGRGRDLHEIGLDGEGWARLADGVQEAAARCRKRGFQPTFHHHACSYVEAPHEIERLLELTDVGLCLDTGHLLLAGGDPVAALAEWAGRIDHLQVKDARLAVLEEVVREQAGMEAVWERGAFCELGTGDLDVEGFLAGVEGMGFSGWMVVEQDRIPAPDEPIERAAQAQHRNRAFLAARGF
ncbi:MAG: sugar phosphate isomerase/epimerase [Actinomycetota bacterium]|nr:sugar phosphate isomerase/epimerase [Actinomycetota bacterium]